MVGSGKNAQRWLGGLDTRSDCFNCVYTRICCSL
jgi:hypothetical protein